MKIRWVIENFLKIYTKKKNMNEYDFDKWKITRSIKIWNRMKENRYGRIIRLEGYRRELRVVGNGEIIERKLTKMKRQNYNSYAPKISI